MKTKEDNVALGRRGEIWVLEKLFKLGWSFPDNIRELSLRGSDWVVKKGESVCRIQVKATTNEGLGNVVRVYLGNNNFDFLIATDFYSAWVIPVKEIHHKIYPTHHYIKSVGPYINAWNKIEETVTHEEDIKVTI